MWKLYFDCKYRVFSKVNISDFRLVSEVTNCHIRIQLQAVGISTPILILSGVGITDIRIKTKVL